MKSYEGYTGIGSVSRSAMKRLLVEEESIVVDRLGRDQREIEIVAIGERATDVGADEQAGGRRGGTEERVLHRR